MKAVQPELVVARLGVAGGVEVLGTEGLLDLAPVPPAVWRGNGVRGIAYVLGLGLAEPAAEDPTSSTACHAGADGVLGPAPPAPILAPAER